MIIIIVIIVFFLFSFTRPPASMIVVPEIDKSPTMLRAASEKNEKGRLVCRVQAAPKPSFTWARSSKTLNNTQNGGKYFIESRQIDPLTYESVLMVDKVETNDYGLYECKAENELGSSRENIRLDVTSKPDPPLSLNVLNTTHDSVSLAWTPGFDGGLKTTYQLRYREASSSAYKYVDSLPNVYRLDVEGLKPNVVYLFSIMAMNNLGSSGWLPDTTKAQTKGNDDEKVLCLLLWLLLISMSYSCAFFKEFNFSFIRLIFQQKI